MRSLLTRALQCPEESGSPSCCLQVHPYALHPFPGSHLTHRRGEISVPLRDEPLSIIYSKHLEQLWALYSPPFTVKRHFSDQGWELHSPMDINNILIAAWYHVNVAKQQWWVLPKGLWPLEPWVFNWIYNTRYVFSPIEQTSKPIWKQLVMPIIVMPYCIRGHILSCGLTL